MQINDTRRARKIAAPCVWCGREFFQGRRAGRRRLFCSDAHRVAAFRYAETEAGAYPTGCNEIDPKTSTKSTTFKGDFADRPSPKVDPETRALIFETELAPDWSGGCEVVSPDDVTVYVMREARS